MVLVIPVYTILVSFGISTSMVQETPLSKNLFFQQGMILILNLLPHMIILNRGYRAGTMPILSIKQLYYIDYQLLKRKS